MNTINGLKIIKITEQYSNNGANVDLYEIQPNAFGKNIPNRKTIMTGEHKIMYNGKLKKLNIINKLKLGKNILRLNYNGEKLYNILLEQYSNVNANGLIAETLKQD